MTRLIYLASPYSDPDPAVEEMRFKEVCKYAVALMNEGGVNIFCPIAHSHPLVEFGAPTHWEYWAPFDYKLLESSDELWVLQLPGWDSSVGVAAEIKFAEKNNIPVRYVNPASIVTQENNENKNNLSGRRPAF